MFKCTLIHSILTEVALVIHQLQAGCAAIHSVQSDAELHTDNVIVAENKKVQIINTRKS